MKKYLISLGLACSMIFTSQCLASHDADESKIAKNNKKEQEEQKKQQAKLERQRKKEEKLRKQEIRKLGKQKRKEHEVMEREEREQKAEAKKEEKLRKQETRKLEKQKRKELQAMEREEREQKAEAKKEEKLHKQETRKLEKQERKEHEAMEREERKRQSAMKKEEAKMIAEEKKMRKEFEKEQKRKNDKLARIKREEKKELKRLNKEKKACEKKERRHLEMQKIEEENHLAEINEKTSREEKQAKIDAQKIQDRHLTANWKNSRKETVAEEYKDGKYADLQILPAWPFSSWFFNEKAMFNVNASYWYAIDSYISDRASRNITALDFGEQTIKLQDILLASKLLGQGNVSIAQLFPPSTVGSSTSGVCPLVGTGEASGTVSTLFLNNFIANFYNNKINFIGKSEKYGLEFDFARHVFRNYLTIGVQVPVLYLRNHLRASMHFPSSVTASYRENASLYYKEELHRVLQSKGINELGGSAIGLGDITLFANTDITTKYVDKIVVGLKVGFPTGKADSMRKLWSPSLSANDKCFEFAAFASMLLNHNTYVNPHLSLQASFFTTSHVNKRVPHMVTSPANAQIGLQVGDDVMAMGDRVTYKTDGDTPPVAISFSDWDTTVRGFADHPVGVKFEKGTEFHVRLGNVFEKFISRRGFFDIYYDLRAKLEDDYRGLNSAVYDIGKMEENTDSIENRIGMEYTQQYGSDTYLKARLNYSFAGINAPKVFDIGLSLGHSF